MKEIGIPFSPAMVLALKDDVKTVTRRKIVLPTWMEPIAPNKPFEMHLDRDVEWPHAISKKTGCLAAIPSPYGEPGDLLWVREAYRTLAMHDSLKPRELPADPPLKYEVDAWINMPTPYPWGRYRSARFMMRRFSRFSRIVTNVGPVALQSISEHDARLEGVRMDADGWFYVQGFNPSSTGREARYRTARECFKALFCSLHSAEIWDQNPTLWRYQFKKRAL